MIARNRLAWPLLLTLLLAPLALPAGGEDGSEERPAPPLSEADLPPALRPWVKWATDGAPPRPCPAIDGEAVCAWPGTLSLTLDNSGGTFSQTLFAGQDILFPLPGDADHWPLGVTLDGKPAPVVPNDDAPALVVTRGEHRITGRFAWNKLPDSLAIPPETALLALTTGGARVARPARDEDGTLTLRGAETVEEGEGDAVRLRIFRRLQDGQPLWLESEFRLTVSGRARELRLPAANYPGGLPVAVSGELPARLDADGSLRVQVRPGNFSVYITEKLPDPAGDAPQQFTAPAFDAAKLPGVMRVPQEIWSFARDGNVREASVEGGVEVDPARAEAPAGWRALPAFALEPGQSLTVTEQRRGAPPAPPDAVSINREWWLDEDGGAFTVRDRLGGTLQRTLRLSMAAPAELGSATLGNDPQLITGGGAPGVEVRAQQLDLVALSRVKRDGKLPATGWNLDAGSLAIQLNLPPGWRLFAAPGADTASGAWTDGWTPWDFFFLVIVAAAVFRLTGWRWGIVGFFALTLSYHELHAPRWSWLMLIAVTALFAIRGAAGKTFVRLLWGFFALLLVLFLMPFFLDQARMTLYPDLHPYAGRTYSIAHLQLPTRLAKAEAPMDYPAPMPESEPPMILSEPQTAQEMDQSNEGKLNAPRRDAGSAAKYRAFASNSLSDYRMVQQSIEAYRQDPHALIQTGPGVPTWSWTSHSIAWNGPVPEDYRIRLWLIPTRLNQFLGLLRIALSAALAFALLRYAARALAESKEIPPPASPADDGSSDPTPPGGMPALAGALLLLALPALGTRAQAGGDIPPADVLKEMRDKLTRDNPPPLCGENCLTTANGRLTIGGGSLALELEVHAGAEAGWPLPGPLSAWAPDAVTLDGKPASALVRQDDGFLYLRLTPGVHSVKLSGPTPPRDAFTLEFKLPPRHATTSATGWRVDGPKAEGGSEPAWQLTRLMTGGGAGASFSGGSYATWLEVRRELQIGLDWKVVTTVSRRSPGDAPVLVKIPLLKGMLVTGDREVKDDTVQIALGQGESSASFEATLKPVADAPVTLRAPAGQNWSEVWVVRCGPVWQCKAEGIPPSARWESGGAAEVFRPWPNEELALTFHRPEGLPGVTRTIESSHLTVTPGPRLLSATLDLALRASRAGALALTLPADAELESVTVNGVEQPVQLVAGKLSINHDAGSPAIRVAWREQRGLRPWFRAPAVTVEGGSINNETTVHLPRERWLLYAFGPAWGPAVLFWGVFVVVLLAAWALGRIPLSPMKGWEWVLLAAGLTQVPLVLGLCIAGWFFALAARGRQPPSEAWKFNLLQIALAGWTLLFLVGLLIAVHAGLMVVPDMQVAGSNSSQTLLHWFQDRATGALPAPKVFSTPLWVYRVLTFAWALWLAVSLLRWLQRGWSDFSAGGAWKSAPKKAPVPPPLPTQAG